FAGCSLLLAMLTLGFAQVKKGKDPNLSAEELASENAKFQRSGEDFDSKANEKFRAKMLAEKKAAEALKSEQKREEAQDKGEGQFKGEF
ncbi:MAG TPA: hypothetical protein VLJ10_02610, partial [Candidatus Bathyarchaeia archaeon]|nr:hypothetical protein [Candidatus Bathyarchaeia archaeon]